MQKERIQEMSEQIKSEFQLNMDEKLQMWRIKDMSPQKQKEINKVMKLYQGDSYIVLFIDRVKKQRNIHFWIGKESTQDEYTTVSILSVFLSEVLGDQCSIQREVQENESSQFLSYFNLVQYLKGGYASGFKEVEQKEEVRRMFHINKSKKGILVRQVGMKFSNLNQGDCFIVEAEAKLFIWQGLNSNVFEKNKAIYFGNLIRDQDYVGKAEIEIIIGNEQNEQFNSYLEGDVSEIKEEEEPNIQEDGDNEDELNFYHVKDAEFNKIEDRPLNRSMLNSDDCFIVQNKNFIYIWVGKQSSKQERGIVFQWCDQLIQQNNLDSKIQIIKLQEDYEDGRFRMLFEGFDKNQQKQYVDYKEYQQQKSFEVQLEIQQKQKELESIQDSRFTQYLVKDEQLQEVEEDQIGTFYDEECYIVDFEYLQNNRKCRNIYSWLGQNRTIQQQTYAAQLSVSMSKESTTSNLIRVRQFKEPVEFFTLIFNQHVFKINKGKQQKQQTDKVLYRVNCENKYVVRIIEQQVKCDQLNSNDCFVYFGNKVYIWQGQGGQSTTDELIHCQKLANRMNETDREIVTVKENEDSESMNEFYQEIGGLTEYQKEMDKVEDSQQPILYIGGIHSSKLRVEKLFSYSQQDLPQDDIAILDCDSQIFCWVGAQSQKQELEQIIENLKKIVGNDKSVDDDSISVVHSGYEPLDFIMHFNNWNHELTKLNAFAEIIDKTNYIDNEVVDSFKQKKLEGKHKHQYLDYEDNQMTMKELIANQKKIDPENKHLYLNDSEFEQLFGIDKDGFKKMNRFKQMDLIRSKMPY